MFNNDSYRNSVSWPIVGNGISNVLSVGVFDFLEPLKIYVPKPGKGYATNPKDAFNQIETQPIGVFSLTEEVDKKYTFISRKTWHEA